MPKNKSEDKKQRFAWIELKIDPNDPNLNIKPWLNKDGTLNVEAMQKDIKKTLIESAKATAEWQKHAIKKAVKTD